MSKQQYVNQAIAALEQFNNCPYAETPEQRAIFLGFCGGGVLKEAGIFSDDDKPKWLVEAREKLKSLLTDAEYTSLCNVGMQNSHYTLPAIRQAMWDAVIPHLQPAPLVLDPGCGVGGFAVEKPSDARYVGVEKDRISCALAKGANFDSDSQFFPENFLNWGYHLLFDLAIGNIPFVNGVNYISLGGKRLHVGLHAQFFIKAVQHLKNGGLLMFLTSTNTLDSRAPDYIAFREWLDKECEFLGALRLPMNRQIYYGDTQVTTDLVVLRRRSQVETRNFASSDFIKSVPSPVTNYNDDPAYYNEWFASNPQYVLGDLVPSQIRGKNGNPANSVAVLAPPEQDTPQLMRSLLGKILGGIKNNMDEPLWALVPSGNGGLLNHHTYHVPGSVISIWETTNSGEWFAIDTQGRNIKMVRDAHGKQTFRGDNAQEVALKSYHWLVTQGMKSDWQTEHPWIGSRVEFKDGDLTRCGDITQVKLEAENVSSIKVQDDVASYITSDYQFSEDAKFRSCTDAKFRVSTHYSLLITHYSGDAMATLIPAEKFQSNSIYAFILRENPKRGGIEIHLPPDCTPTKSHELEFLGKIQASGFVKAKANPNLYYTKYTDDLMKKCRAWVQSLNEKYGATEIGSDEPVENISYRRRAKQNTTSISTANHTPAASTQASPPNKLAEAIAQVVVERLKAEMPSGNSAELEKLKEENARLRAHCDQRDATLATALEDKAKLSLENDSLKQAADARTKSLATLESQVADLTTRLLSLQAELKEQATRHLQEVASIQTENAKYKAVLVEYSLLNEVGEVSADDIDDEAPEISDGSDDDDEAPEIADGIDDAAPKISDEPVEQNDEEGFDLDALGE